MQSSQRHSHLLSNGGKIPRTHNLWLCLTIIYLCQSFVTGQRLNAISCERRPTHTSAHKTHGDNGFSIKILGNPTPQYYTPGTDYEVLLNGSYTNQQFLDFMLVATLKMDSGERRMAGTFTHMLNHMTSADTNCPHVMTSATFHPSYKKSSARFLWTAPPKGSGCVIFKATVVEHPDIWFRDDGGLSRMFCENPDSEPEEPSAEAVHVSHTDESTSHNKRQSTKCCACDVAKYEMTFIGNWSRETHPKDFPPKQFESLLHWSDIIGASHSPSYSVWSYDSMATTGVKEVCEYGWPRTLEGEIKQQSRNVRTVIKANGIWGYPALYTEKRTARFSTDNERPLMSLLTMIGPSPDWCVGVDSVNMCLEDCSWLDKLDIDLYPWDAGTDSGVTYLSNNLPTYPRQTIRAITRNYPNNTASPFYGEATVRPMASVSIRRVGARSTTDPNQRCEASGTPLSSPHEGSDDETDANVGGDNVKCMTSEWSDFSACSVTCGVGVKTRTRMFKHPMGTMKMCPSIKLQELDNCLGLINRCEDDDDIADVCVTTPWSNWSPCSASCGSGSQVRTRQYLNALGEANCSVPLSDSAVCNADIPDCLKATMMVDWTAVCKLQDDSGRCQGSFPRFFYDMNMKKCREFNYGGCRGNQNNFETLEDCRRICEVIMADEVDDSVSAEDIDCMMTPWSQFSDCTVSCGTGLRSRSRMIKIRNSGNGTPCPKKLSDHVVCASMCSDDSDGADVDCMLSEWSHWSDCSTTCDDGVQIRTKMVKRPAQGQGQQCNAEEMKEMRDCNQGKCEVQDYSLCMISEWTPWSECSVACGVGKTMRRRMEKRGPCPGDTVYSQIDSCNGQQCGNVEPVDCQISGWTDWTECDSQCDLGWQTRFRMVTRPAAYGGLCDLEGPKQMEKRTCYLQSCDRMTTASSTSSPEDPVDCLVGDWSDWGACSKTCGKGRQIRRRNVIIKRKNGGARCPPLKDVQHCNAGKCRTQRRRLRQLKRV